MGGGGAGRIFQDLRKSICGEQRAAGNALSFPPAPSLFARCFKAVGNFCRKESKEYTLKGMGSKHTLCLVQMMIAVEMISVLPLKL